MARCPFCNAPDDDGPYCCGYIPDEPTLVPIDPVAYAAEVRADALARLNWHLTPEGQSFHRLKTHEDIRRMDEYLARPQITDAMINAAIQSGIESRLFTDDLNYGHPESIRGAIRAMLAAAMATREPITIKQGPHADSDHD